MAERTEGVVVGYDGSPGSELALRWSAREARERKVPLLVCYAWVPEHLALLGDPQVFDLARRRGAEIVARGVRYAETVTGDGGASALLAYGPAADELCARSRTADMVVTGSRGHGRLAGLLLGSVAGQVAAHGYGRIVVIRGPWRPANWPPGPVVAGVDGSAASLAALGFAAEEAALRDVPLIAICALADAPGVLGGAGRMEEEFSRGMANWEKEHPEVTVLRQVTNGTPRSALLTAANDAQMVVVGSRGRGGLAGMTLGSVTHALLHHASCPVGIARPADRA